MMTSSISLSVASVKVLTRPGPRNFSEPRRTMISMNSNLHRALLALEGPSKSRFLALVAMKDRSMAAKLTFLSITPHFYTKCE